MTKIEEGVIRRHVLTRHCREMLDWQLFLLRIKRWKSCCALKEEQAIIQNGHHDCTYGYLQGLLRKLAKINPNHGGSGVKPDITSEGAVGMRSCSTGSWDNSVRALEEDS